MGDLPGPGGHGGPGLFSGDRAPRVLPLPHPEPPSGGLSGGAHSGDLLRGRNGQPEGSYLDDFCQRFWTGYLDDRLADLDSYNFFLRHEEDFVSSYASTDPSEDISESFAFFVLWDVPESEAVWAEKLRFFLDYPELTEFRRQVRENLGLEQPEQAA